MRNAWPCHAGPDFSLQEADGLDRDGLLIGSCATCGRQASFSVVQDGVQTWACSSCADKLAPNADLPAIAAALLHSRRRPGVCPNCGSTQEQALVTGLVGCPLCYEIFDDKALAHFGINRGAWGEPKTWSLHLPIP